MSRQGQGFGTVAIASAANLITVLPVFLFSSTYVLIAEDTPFGVVELGAVVAGFWLAAAIASTWISRLVNRLGSRLCLSLAAGASAITMAIIATTSIPSWQWYLVILAVAGIANSLAHPASNTLIITGVTPRIAATAFGLKQAAIPSAMMLAGFAVPILLSLSNWRGAFATGALFALIAGLLPLCLAPWRSVQWRPVVTKKSAEPSPTPKKLGLAIWVSALGTGQANAIAAFSVVMAVQVGFSESDGGTIVGVAGITGIISRLCVGFLADRGFGGTYMSVALMLVLGGLGTLAMVMQLQPLYVIGVIFAFCFGWGWNGLVHFLISKGPGESARATGQVQVGAYLGCTLGPLIFGFLFDHYSPTVAAIVCASTAFVAAVLATRVAKQ